MSSVSKWSASAREETRKNTSNSENKNEDLRTIDVIETYLDGGRSAYRSAHTIATIYEPRLKSGQRDDVANLWLIINEAARSISGPSPARLANLIISITRQPDVLSHSGHGVRRMNGTFWRDLPDWGQMFREYGWEIDPPDGNDAEWHAQAPQLLNITTFAATLMLRSDGCPDLSFFASIAMDEGVDLPYDSKRELHEEWRMYVPPAATWIMVAGSKIRELCFVDELPEAANRHSVRSHWGGRTYCPARWRFWKQRFDELARDTSIDERCQDFATQAARAMERLDDGT
ncbi:hypothetical protein AUEXF2481DRAFT_27210 [Aureobasidium subglaciale EXF-2481]|uniref:Uncharacterized protein n=1 Tax=Aureobasidium subglaciale (strain EXF-2481) TaxID=1043005 RepID=A0A074ZH30_AURSE|nr:uncharacterized protein AUEXF2481DRAFT_27210 [Aureobasidium subglaciale EXF-2481]KAI5204342.1 hypothetical protein E4T38_04695 [Aureobasidium subglaciale]KAI5223161.1 hypothetical protein E4T40_04707 [Aureobasidium subglaciale]KAI5226753.1 hypothetical protein E4T41_04650 [Aureobasidium subglaciale]KAI5262426.1 hypothetical protein E4T46_04536 [Aureobasidium subglaciale]KEQ97861.1 hypothetical protein AUEXF2481DRAFT_27210 [Aureobasidium subglaciale EXF-2481]